VHRLDVEPPGFSCCGHRRGHGGWGGQLVTGFSMGGTWERLRGSPSRAARHDAARVNVNGPLYYVGQ
jgi:hypothetical protein